MMSDLTLTERLFSIQSTDDFEALAIDVFRFQHENTSVYRQFCEMINCDINTVSRLKDIPFLPIQFFKSHQIIAEHKTTESIFTSSGTTGDKTSRHLVHSLSVYERTFRKTFNQFYGDIEDYVVLALLPSYLERSGSSLIYMAQDFIKNSKHSDSGFYLNEYEILGEKLKKLDRAGKKILLIGVSFALLDLVEKQNFQLKNTIVMETGGMKGRRKEMTRFELHHILKKGFGVEQIHSEYGMTELLSQAYSKGNGVFRSPSTMDVLIREPEDPLSIISTSQTGGLNIIDLANIYSCSFIATQDLGKKYEDNSFEVLGRFDHSDVRGCNLMVF